MKRLTILLTGLILLSCQSTKTTMTKEEFKTKLEATEKANITNNTLADGWYATLSTKNEFIRFDNKTLTQYFIDPKPIIIPANFSKGEEFENYQGVKGLAIYFDSTGIDAWAKATYDNVDSYLIFILDNEVLSAQLVNSQITNGASAFWKNDLTENQWKRIKSMIKN